MNQPQTSPLKLITEEEIRDEALNLIHFAIIRHRQVMSGEIFSGKIIMSPFEDEDGNFAVALNPDFFSHFNFHLAANKWDVMLIVYGIDFLLVAMRYYEEKEEFERCTAIVSAIETYNREYNQSLPIKMETELETIAA